MLQHIGKELGWSIPPLFTENVQVREDFLSTSTMGSPNAIIRFIYAPAVEHGFGVNYTTVSHGAEYLVIWVEGAPNAESFHHNLAPAAALLYDFIASLDPISEP